MEYANKNIPDAQRTKGKWCIWAFQDYFFFAGASPASALSSISKVSAL